MIVLFVLLWIASGYYAVFKYKGRDGLTCAEVFWKTVESKHGISVAKRVMEVWIVMAMLTIVGGMYTLLLAWTGNLASERGSDQVGVGR